MRQPRRADGGRLPGSARLRGHHGCPRARRHRRGGGRGLRRARARSVGRADPPVAVRSSAIAEDMPDASFAGVQDTYLWICGLEAVLDGIRRCWASFHNPEAVAYREAHGITRGGMSVAVQYMVDARVAGVMFTLNPVSGDRSSIAIDASYGLGVSRRRRRGHARLVPRLEGDARDRAPADRRQGDRGRRRPGGCDDRRARRARGAAGAAVPERRGDRPAGRDRAPHRAHYAQPQDVEWAIDRAARRALHPPEPGPRPCGASKPRATPVAGSAMAMITAAMTGARRDAEGMSDSPDLTPDDVKEILRLVDESQFDEFELETPRITIRFRRGEAPVGEGRAAADLRRRTAGARRRHRADGGDVLPRARPRRAALRRRRQCGRGRARRSASSRS